MSYLRSRMNGRAGLALAALLLCGALRADEPGRSVEPVRVDIPRFTLHQDNATLHEVLLKLTEVTHTAFRGADGEGSAEYHPDPGDKRATVDWHDAPLSHILRDIARLYEQKTGRDADRGYWFVPGKPDRVQQTTREGLLFGIESLRQFETVAAQPGHPARHTTRLVVNTICRSLDGDARYLGLLTRLSLTDDAGKVHELKLAEPELVPPDNLPDERTYQAVLYGLPFPQRHFKRLDAEVRIYDRIERQRFVLRLPAPGAPVQLPIDRAYGPVRLKVTRLVVSRYGVEVAHRLSTTPDAELLLVGSSPAPVNMRGGNGNPYPLFGDGANGRDDAGTRYVEYQQWRTTLRPPVALEYDVLIRTGEKKRVAFTLSDVKLPFAPAEPYEPGKGRPGDPVAGDPAHLPPAFQDPKGGSLSLPPLGATDRSPVRVSLGLSRKQPDGTWSAVHWVQRDAFSDPFGLDGLAPGSYRVRLILSIRTLEGPSHQVRTEGNGQEVTVRRGEAVQLRLPAVTPQAPP